jgi:hypothetical protein
MSVTAFRDIALIVSTTIGALSFIGVMLQYRRNSKLTRLETFRKIRKAYLECDSIAKLLPMLEENDEALQDEPYLSKMTLLGFYEEIALLYKSRAIKRRVVHYMFGYYAIRCWESSNFWEGLNRESQYWALFKWFVKDMKKNESAFGDYSIRSLSL